MSAEVETMAWTGAVPWHGLGVKVAKNLTPKQMAYKAGLDWTVSLRPVMTTGRVYGDGEDYEDGHPTVDVSGYRALVRDTDNRVLTVVGDNWKPVQNVDAFAFFKHFTEAGGATMETAGSLHGGRIIWGLADLGHSFQTSKGDEVRGYLLMMSPHILGRSLIARVTPVRVVCQNTLAMALSGSAQIERRWNHSRAFDPQAAAEAMALVHEDFSKFGKLAKQLRALRMSETEVVGFLAEVLDPKFETLKEYEPNRVVKGVLESYIRAPGAEPGNGWGVLNAVTHWADHVAGRNQDSRLTSAWIGSGADRKMAVLRGLQKLAENA